MNTKNRVHFHEVWLFNYQPTRGDGFREWDAPDRSLGQASLRITEPHAMEGLIGAGYHGIWVNSVIEL